MMRRKASPARRALLFSLAVLGAAAPSCGGGNASPASQVEALRVLAVTASKPYAKPGDTVTFKMTYSDSLEAAGEEPRPVQILWLGGCKNPPGGAYEACFLQLQGVLQSIASGTPNPNLKLDMGSPELSGEPDALAFDLHLPEAEDIFKGATPTESGSRYSTAYVFFAVCAGTMRPAADPVGAGFPLECIDAGGSVLNADSFIVGYTQVYIFDDDRPLNTNPPITGMTLDGAAFEDGPENAPVVARCAASLASEGMPQGCGQQEPSEECATFKIEAHVNDVAEVDPESSKASGAAVREAVWVDYLVDGGELSGSRKLVNDETVGYHKEHATKWTPPAEPGLVTVWATAHDARGGASVMRRFLRVE